MDLITGGTGIVGSHLLLELLQSGQEVRALQRPTSDTGIVKRIFLHYRPADGGALYERIHWVDGDILDMDSLAEALIGVTRVYHAAAMVSFDPRDTARMFSVNIQGTANVVNACLDAKVERLCHVSSTASIGTTVDGSVISEAVPWKQEKHTSPYAVSKHDAELEVQRGIAEGLDAVLVNPCVIIGPGLAKRSSMTMLERVARGTRFYPPGAVSFVDARDVAAAMVHLTDKGATGEQYLLVGESRTYRDLFTAVAEAFGHSAPPFALKAWMLKVAWRASAMISMFTGIRPLLTRHTAHSGYTVRSHSSAKAQALGCTFRKMDDMVRNTVTFMRDAPRDH